jgi:hypothetical protein
VRVPWGAPLDPWVLRFFVVDVIGGADLGLFEKTAWEAPVEMDGTLIWFRHAKFGIRANVYGMSSQAEADELIGDCMRRLGKALPVVRRDLIDPLIAQTVAKGDLTVPNKLVYLLGMFEHFQALSKASAARARTTEPVRTEHANGSTTTFPAVSVARESEFEAVGSLFALFSLLEHLLVIGLTFREYDAETEPFDQFLRKTWGEKFKRVVGVERADGKAMYDVLKSLADGNRNPAAHGGVERGIVNLDVHLDGYGAVPTSVNAWSMAPDYTFSPLMDPIDAMATALGGGPRSEDGWVAVDRVVDWMKTGPLADAWAYGLSGLPIWFDADHRREVVEAANHGQLHGLFERRAWLIDRAANMDW